MSSERMDDLERRKIVVKVRPSTWRDVQMTAAYLGVHIQDLVGWMILVGTKPIVVARTRQVLIEDPAIDEYLDNVRDAILEYARGEE